MSVNQDDVGKATKKNILTNLCNRLDLKNNQTSVGFRVGSYLGIHSHKTVFPWLTRDTINNEIRQRVRAGNLYREELIHQVTTSAKDVFDSIEWVKGGRPVGTTDTAKKHCENAVLATQNEVAGLYERVKKQAGKKRLTCRYLQSLIREVTKRNLLPEDVVSEACIRQRSKKQKLFV